MGNSKRKCTDHGNQVLLVSARAAFIFCNEKLKWRVEVEEKQARQRGKCTYRKMIAISRTLCYMRRPAIGGKARETYIKTLVAQQLRQLR